MPQVSSLIYFAQYEHRYHIYCSCGEVIDGKLGFMLDLVSSGTVSFLDGYNLGSPYA